MQILGELVLLGVLSPVAWALRSISRDTLDFMWKRAVLRRTPDDQLAKVVRELGANRREIRK